jgi:hypothetical protein
MPKTTQEQIEAAIEDTEYGTLAPTCLYSDPNEFAEQWNAYQDAQELKDLALTPAWKILKRELTEEVARREKSLSDYSGNDPARLMQLKMEQERAKYMARWVTDMVETAKDTPRPVPNW